MTKYANIMKSVFTLDRHGATGLRASPHKFDLRTIHLHGNETDKQCVCVLGPGDEVVGTAAQEAPIQRPETRTNGGQLHRDRELLARDRRTVRQAGFNFSQGLCKGSTNRNTNTERTFNDVKAMVSNLRNVTELSD